MRGLKGKRVIVTGAGGGIGKALARRFAEEGSIVGLFDIDPAGLEAALAMVKAAGGTGHAFPVDITDHAGVKAAVARFEAEAGPTDALVNNAGWDRITRFLDTEPAFWEKIIAINLTGALNLHHAVLPGMVARGSGKVVNIASDAGRVGSSGEAVYSACKGGLISFTKTMARELASKRINLNCVCPGPTDTPLLQAVAGEGEAGQKIFEGLKRAIPFRRLGQPDDLAGMVCFLASEDAGFITGQVISVSGGLTMHG